MRRLDRLAWVRSLGIIRSTTARVGLVLGFVVALAIPLRRSLMEITREVRVRSAVNATVEDLFRVEGRSSVLSQQVVTAKDGTQVYLRVATAQWYDEEARQRFMRRASERAGERVHLVLEQLPATLGDLQQLADLIPSTTPNPAVPPPPPVPTRVPDLLRSLRERLAQAAETLALPDGTSLAGVDISIDGAQGSRLRVAYLAPEALPGAAEQILSRQLARAVDDPTMRIRWVHVPSQARPAEEALEAAADLLQQFAGLRAEVIAPPDAARAADSVVARLTRSGIPRERIDSREEPGGPVRLRLRTGSAEPADETSDSEPPGAPRPPR